MLCTITHGLKLGILLDGKSFSNKAKKGMPITVAFFSEAIEENLPASAPTFITVHICDGVIDLKIKSVSIRDR